jgi:hypothetical protein
MPENEHQEIVRSEGEVLPARPIKTTLPMWKQPAVRIIGGGICLLSIAGWLGSNFFQLRGYVNLLVSRIDLYLAALCVVLFAWVCAMNVPRRKFLIPSALTLLIFGAAYGLDRLTLPKKASVAPSLAAPKEISAPPPKAAGIPVNPSPAETKSLPALSPKPYDISNERRRTFLQFAKPPLRNVNKVRIACLSWSERSCVAAGQFLLMLSEDGWTIDENRVFRMDEPVPSQGVSIVSVPEPGPPQPPHLGRWHAMNLSEITLASAFVALGIAEGASGDPTLGEKTTGVYFAVEPESLAFNKNNVVAMQLSKLKGEIDEIEQHPNADSRAQLADELAWNHEAEAWLLANVGKSASLHLVQCPDEKAKVTYFEQERLSWSLLKMKEQKAMKP